MKSQHKRMITNEYGNLPYWHFCSKCHYMVHVGHVLWCEEGRIRCQQCGKAFGEEQSEELIRCSESVAELDNTNWPDMEYLPPEEKWRSPELIYKKVVYDGYD